MIAAACLMGCSDDDDNPVVPEVPEDPRVESVVVAPGSATYTAIGEEIQFTAMAFDQNEAVIDTVITWQSSDPEIVSVDENGGTLATGLGDAQIYAMAGSAADTADVTVTLEGATSTEWIAGGNGNWEEAGNWSGGEVPGSGDVAVITALGDYTVTLNGDVTVDGLVLGAGSGAQTLDTNNHNLQVTNGGLYPGGELLVQNGMTVLGDVVWAGGDVSGGGLIEIASSAELHVTANALDVDAGINVNGTLSIQSGSSLRINDSLDNNSGGLVELQGEAYLSVQLNGTFNNSGTIHKSQGGGEATIDVSSIDASELYSSGPIRVDMGTLHISGGSLGGQFDIATGATLRQSGNTEIRSANMTGDGTLVIGGRATFGSYPQQINIPHLVLDSASLPSIAGEANILVDNTFVWRRGTVALLGSLNTQVHSQTTFEDGGSKALDGTTWNIIGDVHGDSSASLELREGAAVSVEYAGSWHQDGGCEIIQGTGAAGKFDVIGEFLKTGEGTFVVRTGLSCSGTMDLREGVVTVYGDFVLFDDGVLTGGGTADLTGNLRLNVVNATSSTLRGTIDPDLDGQPARFDIQGVSVLESATFTIMLDVAIDGDLGTESVYFLTGGQDFGGTLDLAVGRPTNPGEEFQVIYSSGAQGEFDVEGGEPFDQVDQSATGVVCRNN